VAISLAEDLILRVDLEEGVGGTKKPGSYGGALVVEALQVIEERGGGGLLGIEGKAVAQDLRLYGSEGAFRKGVVITTAFGAHALPQAVSGE
jgi:hypothetical protein